MDYLLLTGFVLCAWVFLRQLGNERETMIRLIEIRAQRDAEEREILLKIEQEKAKFAKQSKASDVSEVQPIEVE